MSFTGRGLYASSSKVPRKRRYGWLFLGGIVAVIVLTIGAMRVVGAVVVSKEDRTDAFGDVERLVLANKSAGRVEFVGNDSDKVIVYRTLRGTPLSETQEDVRLDGDTLRVEAGCGTAAAVFGKCEADYEIGVPDGVELDISTWHGRVSLRQMESDVRVQTSSGQVDVDVLKGDVTASTTSGGIWLNKVEGSMELDTTSGDIQADGTGDSVQASTTSGRIDLKEFNAATVEAESTSGAVNLEGGFTKADIETTSGTINIDTPLSPFERIVAESTSGTVQMRVPEGTYDVTGDSGSGVRDIGVEESDDASAGIAATTTSGAVRINPME